MPERDLEPVHWIASSLRDLKSFPADVQRSVGFNLFRAQEGKKAPNASLRPPFVSEEIEEGRGDSEARDRSDSETLRDGTGPR